MNFWVWQCPNNDNHLVLTLAGPSNDPGHCHHCGPQNMMPLAIVRGEFIRPTSREHKGAF
jgi:hypothetical protein